MQWNYWISNWAFKRTLWLFSKRRIEGVENIPRTGPLIIVSNHLSNLDPPIVASILPRKPVFLAKKELFLPVLGWFLRGYGAYPLGRAGSDLRALRWAQARLRAGGCVVMFPEGTRSRAGRGLLKGHPGAAVLASVSGATLVPVALSGTEPLQNLLRVFCPKADITVTVGRPFRLKGRPGSEQVALEMMVRIARTLPERYRGVYADKTDIEFTATEEVQAGQRSDKPDRTDKSNKYNEPVRPNKSAKSNKSRSDLRP